MLLWRLSWLLGWLPAAAAGRLDLFMDSREPAEGPLAWCPDAECFLLFLRPVSYRTKADSSLTCECQRGGDPRLQTCSSPART